MAPLPEPAVPAYSRFRMPRKRPQVLGVDLNRSERRGGWSISGTASAISVEQLAGRHDRRSTRIGRSERLRPGATSRLSPEVLEPAHPELLSDHAHAQGIRATPETFAQGDRHSVPLRPDVIRSVRARIFRLGR